MLFMILGNREIHHQTPANHLQRPENHGGLSRQGHFHESPRAWKFCSHGFWWSWCEAFSSIFALGGPFGQNQGVLLRLVFSSFNPKFWWSKWAPETKPSFSPGFQTMRNPILSMIFLWDHGFYCTRTAFGPPFWVIFDDCMIFSIRIHQNHPESFQINSKSIFTY